jgi:hypothetical protein
MPMISPLSRLSPLGHGGGSYRIVNAELTTYTTGLTTALSDSQLRNLDTFIASVKTGLSITNLSDAFDTIYVLAGETSESSLRNLVKNAHHATAVNSPTFAKYEGFTGNGTTSYINTNYNPATEADNYALNASAIGIYNRTGVQAAVNDIGAVNASGIGVTLNVTALLDNSSVRHNSDLHNTLNNIRLGMKISSRSNNASIVYYENKTAQNEYIASSSIYSGNIYILCRNNNGSPSAYSSNQLSFAFLGKDLTSTNVGKIVDAFEVYMDANGKGVIS